MIDDKDIYRAAYELVKIHGSEGASSHAAGRITDLEQAGDQLGLAVWRRIRAALVDVSDLNFQEDLVI